MVSNMWKSLTKPWFLDDPGPVQIAGSVLIQGAKLWNPAGRFRKLKICVQKRPSVEQHAKNAGRMIIYEYIIYYIMIICVVDICWSILQRGTSSLVEPQTLTSSDLKVLGYCVLRCSLPLLLVSAPVGDTCSGQSLVEGPRFERAINFAAVV